MSRTVQTPFGEVQIDVALLPTWENAPRGSLAADQLHAAKVIAHAIIHSGLSREEAVAAILQALVTCAVLGREQAAREASDAAHEAMLDRIARNAVAGFGPRAQA